MPAHRSSTRRTGSRSRGWPAAGSTGSSACSTRTPRAGAGCCSPRRVPPTGSPAFEPADAAEVLLDSARERGAEAKELEEVKVQGLELPTREAEQRVRRAQRGAEREELLAALDELEAWYRDLVVVGVGAEAAAAHVDMLAELRADATRERLLGAERAAEAVRATWRRLEEFQLAPQLALEALFVEVARELQELTHGTAAGSLGRHELTSPSSRSRADRGTSTSGTRSSAGSSSTGACSPR